MEQPHLVALRELLRESVRGYRGLLLAAGVVVAVNATVMAAWGPWLVSPLMFLDLGFVTLLFCVVVSRSVAVYGSLARSRDRYARATRGSMDGHWEWDFRTGQVFYDARWLEMLGYEKGAVTPDLAAWLERVHPEDLEALRAELDAHAAGSTAKFEQQYRIRDALGTWRWMQARALAVRDGTGRVVRMAGAQTDIGTWKREEARLLHDAMHDPLTGLPNRALFLDRLSRVSERGRRRQSRYAVLFVDLDRFKVVNDGLGHMVGDELLKVVARRLLLCIRQEDTVARLGGDEFGILLADPRDLADATRVAERVNASLLQPVRIGDNEVFTSVSIGVALSQAEYTDPDEIMRDADAAMYRAKAAGGMRYEVEGGAVHTEAVQQLRLETELRRSIDRGELRLQYQPIVELLPAAGMASSRLTGFEALVRWQHPERGLLMPGEFLPLAEETGIILALDWWVLARVCEHAACWADALGAPGAGPTPLTISVNVSGKHFWHEDFIPRLDRLFAATGARPEHLKLEVTEGAVMRDADAATRVLAEVRRRGIGLAIDDFGTGYSSLTYLQRFPVDAVKIDRSFVDGIGNGARNTELVRSILALARALGLDAVAEGVETTEELQELSRMGCGLAQGYLFSHPLDPEDASELLLNHTAAPARQRARKEA